MPASRRESIASNHSSGWPLSSREWSPGRSLTLSWVVVWLPAPHPLSSNHLTFGMAVSWLIVLEARSLPVEAGRVADDRREIAATSKVRASGVSVLQHAGAGTEVERHRSVRRGEQRRRHEQRCDDGETRSSERTTRKTRLNTDGEPPRAAWTKQTWRRRQ